MAKKTPGENGESILSVALSALKENLLGNFIQTVKENAQRIEHKIFEAALGLVTLVLGVLFLLASLVLFAHNYLGIDFAVISLVIGVALIIVAYALNRDSTF